MYKSLEQRLAALEALEAARIAQVPPPPVDLSGIDEAELRALIAQGLRERALLASCGIGHGEVTFWWGGTPQWFYSDHTPEWEAVAQQANALYHQQYAAGELAMTVPCSADEVQQVLAGLDAGKVQYVPQAWVMCLDVASGHDLHTPLHAAVKAVSRALSTIYDHCNTLNDQSLPVNAATARRIFMDVLGEQHELIETA